jgi:hypothetical protein
MRPYPNLKLIRKAAISAHVAEKEDESLIFGFVAEIVTS